MIQPQKFGSFMIYPFEFGNILLVKKPRGLFMVSYYPKSSSFNDIMPASRKDLLDIDHNPGDFERESELLNKYFRGEKTVFNHLKLDLSTASDFQKKVWALTQKIPYGSTRTYKSLAKAMGHKGYRSIGRALHDNPWIIVVPCHRVIRSNGGLGGFGAGLNVKQYLLDLENKS